MLSLLIFDWNLRFDLIRFGIRPGLIPGHGRVLFYWLLPCQTEIKAMVIPLIFQTVFGIVHGFQHYAIFESTFEKTVCED